MLLFLMLWPTLAVFSQHSDKAISSDGTAIYYRIFGSGQPLLIINGGPGMNSDGFESLARRLSGKYQTIIYDQRGTGKSVIERPDSNNMTMKLMLDDLESIRQKMNLPHWSIMGQSFGGMLACWYAVHFPERIDKMILSSSGGIDLDLLQYVGQTIDARLGRVHRDSMRYWTNKIAAGDTSFFARYQRGLHLAPAYVVNKKFIPQIALRLTQGNALINELIWQDLQKIQFNCAEGLKKFDRPVLIIQGKQDIIKKETAEKAKRILPNSTLVLMDHCSHYGWLDAELIYFKRIDQLMAKEN